MTSVKGMVILRGDSNNNSGKNKSVNQLSTSQAIKIIIITLPYHNLEYIELLFYIYSY